MAFKTGKYEVDKSNPLFDYCQEMCGNAKKLYNVTNYYIRNVMTGVKKEADKRTSNEVEILTIIENALPAFNKTRKNTLAKKIAKIKKDDELSLTEKQEKINKLEASYKDVVMPTADKWFLSYNLLESVLRTTQNSDYLNLPGHVNQQTIKDCIEAWKSYFKALKKYQQNPSEFTGMPKIPKYRKDPLATVTFTNVVSKFKLKGNDVYLRFPKTDKMFNLGQSVSMNDKLAEIKIQPYYDKFLIFVTIKEEDLNVPVVEPNRICAIDLGIKNFAAITNNIGLPNMLFKGKVLCYENYKYEKKIAKIKSEQRVSPTNPFQQTDESNAICRYRIDILWDYMHKVSKRIITWCLENQIDTVIIGSNKRWKDEMNLGKKTNQSFADIPFDKFKKIMSYLGENKGINVLLAEESYTSKASFLDNDPIPTYKKDNKTKHHFSGKRGSGKNYKYYISGNGTKINADLNGSANILRKTVPTAFDNGNKPNFSDTLIIKHPDLPAYHCSEKRQSVIMTESKVISKSKHRRDVKKLKKIKASEKQS